MEYLILAVLAAVLAVYIAIMGELQSIKRLLELLVSPPTRISRNPALCSVCGKNQATEAGNMCKECFPF